MIVVLGLSLSLLMVLISCILGISILCLREELFTTSLVRTSFSSFFFISFSSVKIFLECGDDSVIFENKGFGKRAGGEEAPEKSDPLRSKPLEKVLKPNSFPQATRDSRCLRKNQENLKNHREFGKNLLAERLCLLVQMSRKPQKRD